jgi:glyoxylase-like metal-dependent hydrolase (beta-lactamase superfamily II)
MQLGNWQLEGISGGTFWLDGGVMFGVVPKTLWQHVARPDDQNRILCENRCILARDGQSTVLLDTGYGGKFGRLDRKFYVLEEGEPLLRNLAQKGVAVEDVDVVVFSHLHFDHAGGATRYDDRRRAVLTFPRARHIVGRIEWEDALAQAPELKTAYAMENLVPLKEAGIMEFVEDGGEIVPGLSARVTGGHTRGHLSLLFHSQGEVALYPGDICPSSVHLRRMWCLAYDLYPVETRRVKPQLLGEAADHNWWLLWNHDPLVAASRVLRDPRREFSICDPQENL